jgi:serine/threonine-protein kinase
MQLYCTRPGCSRPINVVADFADPLKLKTVQQKFCTNCGMELILAGRYLPTQFLGQGGFGTTFLARDRYTPGLRHCVVKQFQPAGNLTPDQLQVAQDFFEREAEVLEILGNRHPQIPDLYAFFEISVNNPYLGREDKFFYLVQEFIDGETLEQELDRKGRFGEQDIFEVLQELLKILDFVHTKGSIHRDIKPSNIMRNRDGMLYLLDFGAVKNVAAAGKSTKNPSIIYSAGYAPPEQMYGGQVEPSSDLFALAVTCLVLLTGKPPNEFFDTSTQTWTWRSQLNLDPKLAEVFDRMLKPAPNQRYQSAQDVLTALISPISPISPPPPILPPDPLVVQPPAPPPVVRPAFSTLEILGGAAFTGFQGGLIAIALISLLGTSSLTGGFWIVLLAGLIVAQWLRVIEKVDLGILAGISFGVVGFIPLLHQAVVDLSAGNIWGAILVLAGTGALAAICITSLFRLIYKLLSRFI